MAWLAAVRRYGEQGILGGNIVWYGLAVVYFGLLNKRSVRWMVGRDQQSNKLLLKSLAASMGFLGGMNMALVVLSALLLVARLRAVALFRKGEERAMLFTVLAVGHFSQVVSQRFNPPGILGCIYWTVNLMQALANAYCARVAQDDTEDGSEFPGDNSPMQGQSRTVWAQRRPWAHH